jgi:UV DNA damage endonuclease
MDNAESLMKALNYCYDNGIGDFRINSQILPLKTHPETGYDIMELPNGEEIVKNFKACGGFSRKNNLRTTFHPDQFIVLSSNTPSVVHRSIADLEYQAQVAQWVNVDVINVHAGGVYGDKPAALVRLRRQIDSLSDPVRKRLTLENDDRSYTPRDLLPLCADMKVPLVYDIHHHRCLPDDLTIEAASDLAVETWDREPLFHISSPINGWHGTDVRKHHDYIDINDFPMGWLSLDVTIEVEAKAKEWAVLKLINDLKRKYEGELFL